MVKMPTLTASNSLKSIVTATVYETMQAVATSAAPAAVEAMKNDAVGVQVNAQSQENETTPAIIQGMPNPLDGNTVTHCRTYQLITSKKSSPVSSLNYRNCYLKIYRPLTMGIP